MFIKCGMRIHRFIGNFNLKAGNLTLRDKELFNQFKNVLKLKVGEKVILGDGNLNEGTAEIRSYGKDSIELEVLEININKSEPKTNVILYCAILKKENFELIVQKATEIGIKEIVPIITARTVKLDIRKDRLEKIIREAAEQSGRGVVPILHDPVDFKKAVETTKSNDLNILFDQSGDSRDFSRLNTANFKLTTVFIGPEGGWTLEEIEIAQKSGFKIVSLGTTTLRAETAAIIAAYSAIHSFS